MGLSMIDKLTHFLNPIDITTGNEQLISDLDDVQGRKPVNLYVHRNQTNNFKVMIVSPASFDDVRIYADHLKDNITVVVNLTSMEIAMQDSIKDFMNGVCYILAGNVQRIADSVFIYAPVNVDIDKELYAYSVPTYVKPKLE